TATSAVKRFMPQPPSKRHLLLFCVIPQHFPRENPGRRSDESDCRTCMVAPSVSAARSQGMTMARKTVAFAAFLLWTRKQINGLARGAENKRSICYPIATISLLH